MIQNYKYFSCEIYLVGLCRLLMIKLMHNILTGCSAEKQPVSYNSLFFMVFVSIGFTSAYNLMETVVQSGERFFNIGIAAFCGDKFR